jgi:hypothetical protein
MWVHIQDFPSQRTEWMCNLCNIANNARSTLCTSNKCWMYRIKCQVDEITEHSMRFWVKWTTFSTSDDTTLLQFSFVQSQNLSSLIHRNAPRNFNDIIESQIHCTHKLPPQNHQQTLDWTEASGGCLYCLTGPSNMSGHWHCAQVTHLCSYCPFIPDLARPYTPPKMEF